ncbi:MAG: XRE family transcriptional regulator [Kiritimatiellae bacterium]|nr:XRE family transcriptional regulator [Kiritimatiellia bacterium]
MDKAKLEKLKKAGMAVTGTAEWIGLSPEESAVVDMRIRLAREVERLRHVKGMTQKTLAEELGTRQPGVARMERKPASSTLDALVMALLKLGSTPRRIAALL